MGQREELPSGAASQGPKRTSIWSAIHPRLVEIIRERHSTIIFVNSRRIAERLAGAINELAGEQSGPRAPRFTCSRAALRDRRAVEGRAAARAWSQPLRSSWASIWAQSIWWCKSRRLLPWPAPCSASDGLGHHVGAASEGVIFPKYRADLVACAAVTRAMHEGLVESTRFLRNPLDVLAQQIVAIVAQPPALSHAACRGSGKQPQPSPVEIGVESSSAWFAARRPSAASRAPPLRRTRSACGPLPFG